MFDISCFLICDDVSPAVAFMGGSVQCDNSQYQSQVIGPQTRSRASLSWFSQQGPGEGDIVSLVFSVYFCVIALFINCIARSNLSVSADDLYDYSFWTGGTSPADVMLLLGVDVKLDWMRARISGQSCRTITVLLLLLLLILLLLSMNMIRASQSPIALYHRHDGVNGDRPGDGR